MARTLEIGQIVHQSHAAWMGNDLVNECDEALVAHEGRDYRNSVLKAASCLEGVLLHLARARNLKAPPLATLGPMIGLLRKSGTAFDELLERLDEASRLRNRAAHHQPESLLIHTNEGDSLQMLNIVLLVVEWVGQQIPRDPSATTTAAATLPVFLSVGGPHRLDQQQFLERLRRAMRELGVELRFLTQDKYSKSKPFEQIREIMASCAAALIVGLERSHAYAVFERENSERQKIHSNQYIPTAWNQIESSIASALSLPLLVLREVRLYREGVFEAENHGHQIRDFDVASESRQLSPQLLSYLSSWVEQIKRGRGI